MPGMDFTNDFDMRSYVVKPEQGMQPMQPQLLHSASQQMQVMYPLGQQVLRVPQLQEVNGGGGGDGKSENNNTPKHQNTSTILTTTQDLLHTMLKEVDIFTKNVTQLAQTMHARMTKAEYERDVALGKIGHSSAMNVGGIHSAPQMRRPRSHNVDDKSFSAPMVPSTLPPRQNGGNVKFRMYQPNVLKTKATKTDARKALKNKLPAGTSKSTLSKGSMTPWSKPSVSPSTPLSSYKA